MNIKKVELRNEDVAEENKTKLTLNRPQERAIDVDTH